MAARHAAGVERLHHHHRGPEPVHRHGVDQGRGVVEGRRGEIDRSRVQAQPGHALGQHHRDRSWITGGTTREDLAHTFGHPGGAGGVEHLAPFGGIVDGEGEIPRGVPPRRAGIPPPRHPPRRTDPSGQIECPCGRFEPSGDHEDAGAAVIQDVLGLALSEWLFSAV